MICALIMAGGRGTRFWPLSTDDKPKQFLNLIGEDTMIQMTVKRINKLIPMDRIFVCTGEKYVALVKEQLPNLPERNIIVEPEGRNTAPCIALSALVINRYYKDATMVVLPSDHLINKEEEFLTILSDGNEFLDKNQQAILTLGITPTRPETGYGYIKYSDEKTTVNSNEVIKVESFVEKPNLETAMQYLANGSYLWNGGMFMWRTSNIIGQIKKHLPNTYEALYKLEDIEEVAIEGYINENYSKTDATSIDYGILEKSKSIYVIPSDISWDDIGSWEAVDRYRETDELGNILLGDIKNVNGKNNLIVSSNMKVIIDNLDDIYVIENDGHLVIGKRENVNKVKELKDL